MLWLSPLDMDVMGGINVVLNTHGDHVLSVMGKPNA